MDKCNDLAPLLNEDDSKLLKEQIGSKLTEIGAKVRFSQNKFFKRFNRKLINFKVQQFSQCLTTESKDIVAPTIIQDLGLNSEFNLNEVTF